MKIEKIDLCEGASMRIGEIESSSEYRVDEQLQNCQFWFFKLKNSRNLSIFQFGQFQKFHKLEN